MWLDDELGQKHFENILILIFIRYSLLGIKVGRRSFNSSHQIIAGDKLGRWKSLLRWEPIFQVNTIIVETMTESLLQACNINSDNPTGIYLLKVNKRNTRTMCDLFKVNNKDTSTASMASFWCLYC